MSRMLVDSGIKWIGFLPNTWSITTVNKLFYRRKEVNDSKDPTILSLARDGVKIRDISTNEGQLAENYDNYHKVYKGDLLVNPMDLISGANCSLSEVEGVISPAYINLAKKTNIYPKYYDYFFKYQYWIKAMFIHGKGVSFDNRWTINWETMASYKVPFPKYDEQKRIVDYLDKKCSKIDEIIKDNNKEIELLEEYKMKVLDSSCLKGIEQHNFINVNHYSINKIPTGWKFKKTLSVLKMPITDGPHLTPNLIDDGIPFISADAIKDGKIDFSRKRGDISKNDYIEFSRKYVPKLNDIYMIKSGATTGKVGIVETKEKFTIWSPLAVYRADEKEINFKYLYYLLQTNFYQKQVQLNWSFGTQQNIGMRTLEKLKVLVPPLEEQEKIVNYIDDRINKLNQIINYRKQIIEKLEEYKKSLIYECVTGKREV